MKHSKKDINNLGDIYMAAVEVYKSSNPITESIEEPVKESEVLTNRRKKFQNTFNEIIKEYKK